MVVGVTFANIVGVTVMLNIDGFIVSLYDGFMFGDEFLCMVEFLC